MGVYTCGFDAYNKIKYNAFARVASAIHMNHFFMLCKAK